MLYEVITLLQFWSALDRGSRILNPVLVEVYNKYKNKGFEIYQVSVDENRYEWLDAIDKDKLRITSYNVCYTKLLRNAR